MFNVAKALVGALTSLTIKESTLVKTYKYDARGKPFSTVTIVTEHLGMQIEEKLYPHGQGSRCFNKSDISTVRKSILARW